MNLKQTIFSLRQLSSLSRIAGFILGSLHVAVAQPDSIEAMKWINDAIRCRGQQLPDSVQYYVHKAIQIYHKSDRIDWWLRATIRMAYHQSDNMNQPFEAVDFLQNQRKNLWRQPANKLEWQAMAQHFLASGYIAHHGAGNVEQCNRFYQEAYQIFQEKLYEDNDKIANYLYPQLANTYTRLGEYKKAEQLLLRSIQYWERKNQPENIRYSDLAIIYNDLEQLDKSLSAIDLGFKYANSNKSRHYLYNVRLNVLFKLRRFNEIEKWLVKYNQLIEKMRRAGGDATDEMLSGLYNFRARLFVEEKKYALADEYFQKAITCEIKYRGKAASREVAKMRWQYAGFLLQMGRQTEALHQYQQMLTAVLPQFRPSDDVQNPEPKHFFAENVILEAIEGKSKVFENMGNLEAALACLELIPEVENHLRNTFSYEFSALHSLRESRERFERAVELAWRLFERDGNTAWAARAFRLTEQARGVLMLKSLVQVQREVESALPPTQLEKLQYFRAKIAWLERQIAEAKDVKFDATILQDIENQLLNVKNDEEKFLNRLRNEHPDWAAAQARTPPIHINDVPRLLRKEQCLVSYFLTEKFVFIFHVRANGSYGWRRFQMPPLFREHVLAFSKKISQSGLSTTADIQQFQSEAYQLFDELIAPELPLHTPCNALLIVPDDVLVFLPFEVLCRPVDSRRVLRWRDVDFLIKRYSMNYTYSATLYSLQTLIASRRSPARKYCVAFAPNYHLPSDSILQGVFAQHEFGSNLNLKGTHIEVNNLHQQVGATVFDGDAATESVFKNVANEYRILHLAMHAVADESAPELSKLIFGDPIPNGAYDDNLLYANELQAMRIVADLAVLSACHTGYGKIYRGEGVYSLARVFAMAGVPATVMSLWRLPDHTAPILMAKFYEHLIAGKEKDEALQLAKIDYLQTDSLFHFNHPKYWAGLITNGASTPIPLSSGFSPWWWLWCGGLALAIWLLLCRQRRRSTAAFALPDCF